MFTYTSLPLHLWFLLKGGLCGLGSPVLRVDCALNVGKLQHFKTKNEGILHQQHIDEFSRHN
jgi:hypothetical protein